MRYLLITAILFSTSVHAKDIGSISKDGNKVSIIDTYSTFNEETQELTVYLLPCKYSKELKVGWKPEFGFLKCFPIAKEEYFSSPGASISIKLNGQGKAGRVIFSTTSMGNNSSLDYQGFSQSWFRNSPISGPIIKEKTNINFQMNFDIAKKSVNASLNVNTKLNEIIR